MTIETRTLHQVENHNKQETTHQSI